MTDEITSFDPKLFNSNYEFNGVALKMKENVIFLGGGFAAIDTRSRNHLVELDLTTGLPSNWNPSDIVTNILVAENRLYIYGSFTQDMDYLISNYLI